MSTEAPALGPDPRIASAIAYAGGWMTGALVWLLERQRPSVRFHGVQSVLLFGALTVIWLGCWVLSFAVLVVSADGFFALQRLAQAVLLVSLIFWVAALVQAARGAPFRLPLLGPLAERLTPALPPAVNAAGPRR